MPPRAVLADLPAGLCVRLRQIEAAFRDGDAASLRSTFASSGRVRLDLEGLTPGPASYAPGQLQVIVSRLFEGRRTTAFSLGKGEVSIAGQGTAFARGSWSWQSQGQPARSLTLTFVLSQESGDWRVREILASR